MVQQRLFRVPGIFRQVLQESVADFRTHRCRFRENVEDDVDDLVAQGRAAGSVGTAWLEPLDTYCRRQRPAWRETLWAYRLLPKPYTLVLPTASMMNAQSESRVRLV